MTTDYKAQYEKISSILKEEQDRCTRLGYEGIADALDSLEIRLLKEKTGSAVSGTETKSTFSDAVSHVAQAPESSVKRENPFTLVPKI